MDDLDPTDLPDSDPAAPAAGPLTDGPVRRDLTMTVGVLALLGLTFALTSIATHV